MTAFTLRALCLALLALLLVLTGCSDDDEAGDLSATTEQATETSTAPDKVTFMAGFKAQANLPFVGVYVAQEQGFFADENLEVDIQHVTTPGDNFRFLATGEVQFSTADASAVLERRTGDPPLPLVSLALIGQRGQQGFAVLADSGIAAPTDWAGKTAGYKGAQVTPDYLAILAASGVDRASVQEVKVGFEPQILTEKRVDIFPVFVSNEPDTLRRLGVQVKVFEAADFGAPTIGLTYIATEEYIEQQPDVVRRFLKAALQGIYYALDNREAAVDIVLKYAPQENREHQAFMLDTELRVAIGGPAYQYGIGWQTPEQWQMLHDFLVQHGALPRPLEDPAAASTDEFLNEIYENGKIKP
jgi:ABC-type nitrate/sulfonate/bicarbonate transport system substrate-binding protein